MGECILQMGSGINTRDIAPQCRNLTLVGGDAKIDVSFSGVAAEWLSLVKFYRIIAKAGAAPASPTDGVYMDLPPAATGNATMQAALTGLTNDQPYTVRVYVRSPRGWQTSPEAKATATPRRGIKISTLPVGALIRTNLGNFFVVQQGKPSEMYDISCDGTWLLMKDVYENRQWHGSNENDYANSTIRSYLDGAFLNNFNANIRNAIKQVKIPYRPGSGNSMSVNSGANGLSCKIFLLSGYEVGWTNATNQYFPPDGACLSYFAGTAATDAKRIAYLNGSAPNWWLRSPGTYDSTSAWFVHFNGYCGNYYCSSSHGVRPALVLSFDTRVSPTPNADGSYNLI